MADVSSIIKRLHDMDADTFNKKFFDECVENALMTTEELEKKVKESIKEILGSKEADILTNFIDLLTGLKGDTKNE